MRRVFPDAGKPSAVLLPPWFTQEKTGVVIDESKQYLVVARLLPIVRQRKLPSLDTLIDRIRTAPKSA